MKGLDFGARRVARALAEQGVTHLFTLCGGHIQAIYDGCLDHGIRVVDFRHEQSAAFAADAWGRLTGRAGVAAVTAGPGITNAVTALATARRAQSPMVVLAGQAPLALAGQGALQEMDALAVVRPVCKAAWRVWDPADIPAAVDLAFAVAEAAPPGPVVVELPLDVLYGTAAPLPRPAAPDADPWRAGWPSEPAPLPPPDAAAVRRAAELLAESRRPLVFAGSQLRWAAAPERVSADVARLAERLLAPVYANGLARGILPPAHPHAFAASRKKALMEADAVVLLGAPLDFRLGYGRAPAWNEGAALVRADMDAHELARNRTPQVGAACDPAVFLRALLEELEVFVSVVRGRTGRLGPGAGAAAAASEEVVAARLAWLEDLREEERRRAARMAAGLASEASPVHPLRFAAEIERALPDGAIVVGDGGDIVATVANVVRPRRWPGGWLDPGPLGTLGVGAGYAMAARLAEPDAPVLAVFGDGAFGFSAMELEAAARQDVPFVAVIGNDGAWTQIRREQVQIHGADRAVATSLSPDARHDRLAEALGGQGWRVERPEELAPALDAAFSCGRPAVVDVRLGASDFRDGAISV